MPWIALELCCVCVGRGEGMLGNVIQVLTVCMHHVDRLSAVLTPGFLSTVLCRYVDAALYLTELQSDGVLGAVGVTNFDVPRLEAMINKGAQIASNQVQAHLRLNLPLHPYAQAPYHSPSQPVFCLCIFLQPDKTSSAVWFAVCVGN
jgi:hypothetical protein